MSSTATYDGLAVLGSFHDYSRDGIILCLEGGKRVFLNRDMAADALGDIMEVPLTSHTLNEANRDLFRTRPLMERLKGLGAEVDALEAKLAEQMVDVPDLHPNMAELYRRKVERLSEALSQP